VGRYPYSKGFEKLAFDRSEADRKIMWKRVEADMIGFPEDLDAATKIALSTLLQHDKTKRTLSSDRLKQMEWFNAADLQMVPPTPGASRQGSFADGLEDAGHAMPQVLEDSVFKEFDSVAAAAVDAASPTSPASDTSSFTNNNNTPTHQHTHTTSETSANTSSSLHPPSTPSSISPLPPDARGGPVIKRRSSEPSMASPPQWKEEPNIRPAKVKGFFNSWRAGARRSSHQAGMPSPGNANAGTEGYTYQGSKSERRPGYKADGITPKMSPWKKVIKALKTPFRKKKSKHKDAAAGADAAVGGAGAGAASATPPPTLTPARLRRPSGGLVFETPPAPGDVGGSSVMAFASPSSPPALHLDAVEEDAIMAVGAAVAGSASLGLPAATAAGNGGAATATGPPISIQSAEEADLQALEAILNSSSNTTDDMANQRAAGPTTPAIRIDSPRASIGLEALHRNESEADMVSGDEPPVLLTQHSTVVNPHFDDQILSTGSTTHAASPGAYGAAAAATILSSDPTATFVGADGSVVKGRTWAGPQAMRSTAKVSSPRVVSLYAESPEPYSGRSEHRKRLAILRGVSTGTTTSEGGAGAGGGGGGKSLREISIGGAGGGSSPSRPAPLHQSDA
jgi:hypothetical protein